MENITTTIKGETSQQNKTAFDIFLKLFRLNFNPQADIPADKIQNIVPVRNADTGRIDRFDIENLPSEVRKFKDWYLNKTLSQEENWKNRQNLWQDLYLLKLNNPYISRSIELMADEVIQVDAGNSQPIKVEAKKKMREFILKFFDKCKINQKIRPTAIDYATYGNALWLLGFDDTGISDVVHTSIREFDHRIEFTPYIVKRETENPSNTQWGNFISRYRQSSRRIDQLVKSYTNTDNVLSYFKSYLYGYVVSDQCLPPWRCLHFRNITSEGPFVPFGMPLFIYSLAPHNKMEAAATMKIIAQGLMFPKSVYQLNIPNAVGPTEKISMALEYANILQNSGLFGMKKENDGLNERIITIKDLYEFSMESPDFDLDKLGIGDEFKDALIVSTFLPRNLIDPNDSNFGDSGISLVEKWKPFARLVYRIQQEILAQLTQLVKIHAIQSRQFSIDEINFSLSMPYPESQISSDLIQNQAQILELSNNILQAFSDRFFGGEPVPEELAKLVYHKFFPYDDSTKDSWFKAIDKEKIDRMKSDIKSKEPIQLQKPKPAPDLMPPLPKETPSEKVPETPPTESVIRESFLIKEATQKLKESKNKLIEHLKENKMSLNEFVDEELITTKCTSEVFREYVFNKRHHYSSDNPSVDFDPKLLVAFDKKIMNEDIELGLDGKKHEEEIIKYKFKLNESED